MQQAPQSPYGQPPAQQPYGYAPQQPVQYVQPVQPVYAAQPMVYQPVRTGPTNAVATTSMILGIASIVIGFWAWIPFLGIGSAVIGGPLGIAAVIVGHIGLKKASELNDTGKNAALTGLITGYITVGIVGLVTAGWMFLWLIGSASSAGTGA